MSAAADEVGTEESTQASTSSALPLKQIIAGAVFLALALGIGVYVAPTVEIAWVTGFLLLTVYLFAFEVVGVDVAAVSVMVLLGLTSLLAPYMGLQEGLVDTNHLFDGFASNAVISIIAVMIIGAGLDKTGLMSKVAAFILKIGGTSEGRIIPIISSTVGIISSFMQNVGAAALFLPVVSRISARSGLPMSRLLMPMGFCAILGGTVTMVGSSPLILLNDLILASNQSLPADQQMQTWGLFSVTPVGLVLVLTGIIYFVLAGRFVLPVTRSESSTSGSDPMKYIQDLYGLNYSLSEVVVSDESTLIGKTLDDVESRYGIRVIASKRLGEDQRFGPGSVARDIEISAGMVLGLVASPESVKDFADEYRLKSRSELRTFSEALATTKSGIAEVVIPPGSGLIDQSARDVWLRKAYGLALIGLHRNGKTLREGEDIRNLPFMAGDTLVVHTAWDALVRLETNRDFVVVTTEYPKEEARPQKLVPALVFFGIALFLVLFTDIRLSVALLTGAVGMILTGVIKVEEAYEAVSWKTVFLLASLIPLGVAVQASGTAKWIAEQTLSLMGADPQIWVVQTVIAVLATFFTLVMSNVGATVLLVPLAVNIALQIPGANPAVFALTVAIATSNSFLIPTHQVNALIMGPGGYRVPDFMKAGGIMTILFLVVMMVMMGIVF
ncbi:Transporter, sodium/sulfate symporter family [hydrothermal vent metagenome]|uniref:Transporter, sodium/sulfate symporter family n=1 Tax=hydrothermal vent metagenome TaxID=652676 RepID=A0A3B0YCJ7_9ZZZZ